MLKPREISLIQNRLNKAKKQRAELLKLKKSERGDKLQEVEKRISNLKRWLKNE